MLNQSNLFYFLKFGRSVPQKKKKKNRSVHIPNNIEHKILGTEKITASNGLETFKTI